MTDHHLFTPNRKHKVFKMVLIGLAVLVAFFILAFIVFFFWASSGTQPREKLSEIITYPGAQEALPPQEIFTVMTYNAGYFSAMTNNQPVRRPGLEFFQENLDAFVRLLKEIRPDFIGYQEIDFYSRRSHYIDQLKVTAEKTGYRFGVKAVNWDKRYVPFPYWPPAVNFGRMLSGQALLSRWPVIAAQRIELQKMKNKPFYYNALYLDRLAQVVRVQAAGRIIVMINLHLEAFDRETRESQARSVLDLYRSSYRDNYPTLVMGDFNSVPPDAPQKKGFIDEPETDFSQDNTLRYFLEEPSLKAAELSGFTFPTDSPTRKLDYIFYNPAKIRFIKSWIPFVAGSDHLPVVMEFSL